MDTRVAGRYKSASQIARVVSENWASQNLYCPSCNSDNLFQAPNNTKAYDFCCDFCRCFSSLKALTVGIRNRFQMLVMSQCSKRSEVIIRQTSLFYSIVRCGLSKIWSLFRLSFFQFRQFKKEILWVQQLAEPDGSDVTSCSLT